jgi:hypothetical protein
MRNNGVWAGVSVLPTLQRTSSCVTELPQGGRRAPAWSRRPLLDPEPPALCSALLFTTGC